MPCKKHEMDYPGELSSVEQYSWKHDPRTCDFNRSQATLHIYNSPQPSNMSPSIPQIGDHFTLGKWTWEVKEKTKDLFRAVRIDDSISDVWLFLSEAPSLDWIRKPVTISEEAISHLTSWLNENSNWEDAGYYIDVEHLKTKLASMREKE